MRNVDVVDDLLDAGHLTDDRFGVPFCQASIDHAIQIHHIGKRLHSDRSRGSQISHLIQSCLSIRLDLRVGDSTLGLGWP